jgi:hypothetical protein
VSIGLFFTSSYRSYALSCSREPTRPDKVGAIFKCVKSRAQIELSGDFMAPDFLADKAGQN